MIVRLLPDFLSWMSAEGLAQITALLRYPVLLVLFGLTMWVIMEIGMITFEGLARLGKLPKRELNDLEAGIHDAQMLLSAGCNCGSDSNAPEVAEQSEELFQGEARIIKGCTSRKFVHLFLNRLSNLPHDEQLPIRLERLIEACDAETAKELERTRAMVRLGPMLGLMGTLIPMGPALLALTQGDIETLASSLIYAFGTTVLGLLVATIAYVVTTVRQHWYDRDMDDIRYICEMLFGGD
jgi:biopolymer transport protein ExbB/TolQ